MTNPVRCKTEQGKRVACPASNEMIPGNSRSMVRPAPVYRKINGCHLAGLWLVRIQNPAYEGASLNKSVLAASSAARTNLTQQRLGMIPLLH